MGEPIPGTADCPLCLGAGGALLWSAGDWRVVRVEDTPAHPAFYRLIARAHVAEFTDLTPAAQADCLALLAAVERGLRDGLAHAGLVPVKVNLASLGNVVPHLHWHVLARFAQDAQFPAPIWAAAQRADDPGHLRSLRAALPTVDAAVQQRLSAFAPFV